MDLTAKTESRRDSSSALFFDHTAAAVYKVDAGPLRGLRHRTVIDHSGGAASLALWQEEHLSGFEVPLHLHDCEEIITVVEGAIIAAIGERAIRITAGQSVLIPAWIAHGFKVVSEPAVKLLAIFSLSNPGIFRVDGTRSSPPWEGGASDHLSSAPP